MAEYGRDTGYPIVHPQSTSKTLVGKCSICGTELYSLPNSLASGYAIWSNEDGTDALFCYECAARMEKDVAKQTGKLFAYYTKTKDTGYCIATWAGWCLSGPVSKGLEYRSNFGDMRVPVWFSIDGEQWQGTYYKSAGDYVRARRVKGGNHG